MNILEDVLVNFVAVGFELSVGDVVPDSFDLFFLVLKHCN